MQRDPDDLPPVPMTPGRQWRQFRFKLLPILALSGTIIAVIVLWRQMSSPSHFFGEVETVQSMICSPDSGLIAHLWVGNFQEVKAGMLIAEVTTTDPRTANNRLSVMRGRMQLAELEMSPVLRRQRSALDYERMAVDCEKLKSDIAITKVNLEQAGADFERDEQLFKEGMLAHAAFERSGQRVKLLETEITEGSRLVDKMERMLERLNFLAEFAEVSDINDPVRQALEIEAEKVRAFEEKMKPLQLYAPIDGVVTFVHRRTGEQVVAGEPIVRITGFESERIIGHVPASSGITPKIGMKVEVTTHLPKRQTSQATILGVSPHVSAAANAPARTSAYHTARPISISLPPDLSLIPGEPVQLRFVKHIPSRAE
jgi:multidrug resistance efflux pump